MWSGDYSLASISSHSQNFCSWTLNLVFRASFGPYVAQVRGELCPKNFTISQWALKKTEKNILVFTVSPGSCFLASDTGVTAVTAEPNLPGLLSDTDLSLVMICFNTRPLTSSHYISASPHPGKGKKEKKKIILWFRKTITFQLNVAFNVAVIFSSLRSDNFCVDLKDWTPVLPEHERSGQLRLSKNKFTQKWMCKVMEKKDLMKNHGL